METVFSPTELGLLAGGLMVASLIAGFLAGFLGVGGGIVLVPTLFWLFTFIKFPDALSMHMAVATSLATIIFTSISSMRAHHEKGAVDVALLKLWAPGIAIGALAGGLASRHIDAASMKAVFGVVALLVSINLATPRTMVVASHLPASRIVNFLISLFTGLVSALMGIGGGTLSVPILAACAYPIRRAVGTASAFGLLIALPAVTGFVIAGQGIEGRPPFSFGFVNLVALMIIIPFTTFMAPYGARMAHSVDPLWVKRGFAVFLSITAARMLYGVFS